VAVGADKYAVHLSTTGLAIYRREYAQEILVRSIAQDGDWRADHRFQRVIDRAIFDWFSDSLDSLEQWRGYYERRERWSMEHGYRIRRIVERTIRNGPRKAFIAVLNAFQDVTQEMEGIAGWEPWLYETANLTINAVLSEQKPPSLSPVSTALAATA
jgi:hypothetical protein